MGGNKAGGLATKARLLAIDPDYYRKIGAKGGKATTGLKGFAVMSREKVSAAGTKGGSISKRGPHPQGCTCKSHSVNTWINNRKASV